MQEKNGSRQKKSDEKQGKQKLEVLPVVECDKLEMSDDSYTASCKMPKSTVYKCLQTAHRGKCYTGPWYGVKPLTRNDKPCYLGNLKNLPSSNFTNTGEGETEIVEEQQYSSNILADAEICTETEMGYEEWCAAQDLLDLKSDAGSVAENVLIDETQSRMYKQLQTIHSYLNEIFNFVQGNIVSEAEHGPLLRK